MKKFELVSQRLGCYTEFAFKSDQLHEGALHTYDDNINHILIWCKNTYGKPLTEHMDINGDTRRGWHFNCSSQKTVISWDKVPLNPNSGKLDRTYQGQYLSDNWVEYQYRTNFALQISTNEAVQFILAHADIITSKKSK